MCTLSAGAYRWLGCAGACQEEHGKGLELGLRSETQMQPLCPVRLPPQTPFPRPLAHWAPQSLPSGPGSPTCQVALVRLLLPTDSPIPPLSLSPSKTPAAGLGAGAAGGAAAGRAAGPGAAGAAAGGLRPGSLCAPGEPWARCSPAQAGGAEVGSWG